MKSIDFKEYYYKYKALKYYFKNNNIEIQGGGSAAEAAILQGINFDNVEENLLYGVTNKMKYEDGIFTLKAKQKISKDGDLYKLAINDPKKYWNKKRIQGIDPFTNLFLAYCIDKDPLAVAKAVGADDHRQRYIHDIDIKLKEFNTKEITDMTEVNKHLDRNFNVRGQNIDTNISVFKHMIQGYVTNLEKKYNKINKVIIISCNDDSNIAKRLDYIDNTLKYTSKYYHWQDRADYELKNVTIPTQQQLNKGSSVEITLYLHFNDILFTNIYLNNYEKLLKN